MTDRARPAAPERRRRAARQPEPAHARRATAAPSSTTPNLDRFAARADAVHQPRTPVRCRACRRATTSSCGALDFLWRPWGSIELWEQPITAALRGAGRDDDARVRPSAPVRDRRRELPHRLQRAGTTSAATRATRGARAPTRRVGMPARRVDGGWFTSASGSRRQVERAVRRLPHVVPRRGRLPRSAHDARRPRRGCDDAAGAPRPVAAVRRRVRPARAVRHARAVGRRCTTTSWDGERSDLAAVRRRRRSRRACSTERRAARSGPTTAPSCR